MNSKQRHNRLLQSASAFASAILLTLIMHEFAHGLVAKVFYGLHPVVYGLQEKDLAHTLSSTGVIDAAGPIASLIIGLIFLFVIHKRLKGQGYWRYLTLWLGVLGMATFAGYLLITPFFHDGDTYQVLRSLHLTSAVFSYILCALGVVTLIYTAKLAAPYFIRMTNADVPLRPQMVKMGLLAWLVGGVAVILLTIPAYPFMILATGAVAPLTGFFASKRPAGEPYGVPGAEPGVSIFGIVLLIVLVLLEQTVLRNGVKL